MLDRDRILYKNMCCSTRHFIKFYTKNKIKNKKAEALCYFLYYSSSTINNFVIYLFIFFVNVRGRWCIAISFIRFKEHTNSDRKLMFVLYIQIIEFIRTIINTLGESLIIICLCSVQLIGKYWPLGGNFVSPSTKSGISIRIKMLLHL